jgi:hypothetical protein
MSEMESFMEVSKSLSESSYVLVFLTMFPREGRIAGV